MNKEDKILKTLSPDFGQLRLTNTMLNKAIIDANTSIRRFAKLFGIDFDTMVNGEKHKLLAYYEDDTVCTISFYKTVNRGDRRLSISGIKKKAEINDLIAFNYKRIIVDNDLDQTVIVINVTAKAENRKTA
jgi:phosphatidate phosphatase APP1